MIDQERRTHLVKPGGQTRLPRSHAFLDVETASVQSEHGWREVWRLACCAYMTGDVRRGWKSPELADYDKPWQLWADINWRCPRRGRLVVWAHNLAYDLRASQALSFLPALGFRVAGISLERTASWARFQRGEQSILFCDLHSWLPAPLGDIAADLGLRQPRRPARGASDEVWRERCRQDVRVVATAVLEILHWVESADLGSLRPTGAGQANAIWRRQFLSCPPVVHDQEDVLKVERRAMWTGRCEAWRHGLLSDGPYVEFDLPLAYPRIAAGCDAPRRLAGRQVKPTLEHVLKLSDRYRVLAEVTATLHDEVVPAADGEYIAWPVGRVKTALWDPELSLLASHASNVEIAQAWLYEPGPVLRDVSEWIIGVVEGADDRHTPLRRRLAKHWARALIGRVALRYRTWEPFADIPDDGLGLGLFEDATTGEVTDLLHIGNQLQVLSGVREADESLPMVTGWIMSEARRRLWNLLLCAGLDHVIYLDTDSVIVDQPGAVNLRRRIRRDGAWGLRVKRTYERLDVRGPRMLILDDDPRIAGIPKSAVVDAAGDFHATLFMGLRESVLRRSSDSIQTLPRTYRLTASDRRRLHALDGRTTPKSQEDP